MTQKTGHVNNVQLWSDKYSPKSTKDIIGQDKAVGELSQFVTNYKKQRKKAALLYGGSGTAKTSSVYALANDLGLEVLEINSSDVRNKDAIESVVGGAIGQHSLFAKGKIILIDEVDGLSGNSDRGGLPTLITLFEKSAFPIVLTTTDPYDQKFSSLRSKTLMIEYHTLAYPSIVKILKNICKVEGIDFDEESLVAIARSAGGDARAAINDLCTLAAGNRKIEKSAFQEYIERDMTESMINALVKVFKTLDENNARTAFDNIDEDPSQIMLWLDENIPAEYTKPKDLARAYDALSKADVFQGRIRSRQHWRFLVYINALMSSGVAFAKDEKYPGFTSYKPTSRLLRIWQSNMKYQKRNEIAKKLAAKTHTSLKRAKQTAAPYLSPIFKKDKKQSERISAELELTPEEIEWLRK